MLQCQTEIEGTEKKLREVNKTQREEIYVVKDEKRTNVIKFQLKTGDRVRRSRQVRK